MASLATAPTPGLDRDPFYDTPGWRAVSDAAISRDGSRCLVAWLLGGACSGALHAHHIIPRRERPDLALDLDNLGTACAGHHPVWERCRREILRARERAVPRCRHRHVTREGREACERRMARDRGLIAA
jgi:hypothetical protein